MSWVRAFALEDVPALGARVARGPQGDIAVFRTAHDQVFALEDRCPHKGGPLSQGIVYGTRVACPLHAWQICLEDGRAQDPDEGCARRYESKVEGGMIWLKLAP